MVTPPYYHGPKLPVQSCRCHHVGSSVGLVGVGRCPFTIYPAAAAVRRVTRLPQYMHIIGVCTAQHINTSSWINIEHTQPQPQPQPRYHMQSAMHQIRESLLPKVLGVSYVSHAYLLHKVSTMRSIECARHHLWFSFSHKKIVRLEQHDRAACSVVW